MKPTSNHGISLLSRFHDNVILIGSAVSSPKKTPGLDSWWNPYFECKVASQCCRTSICLFKLFHVKKREKPVCTESTHVRGSQEPWSPLKEKKSKPAVNSFAWPPAGDGEPPWPFDLGCTSRLEDEEVWNSKTSSKSQHNRAKFLNEQIQLLSSRHSSIFLPASKYVCLGIHSIDDHLENITAYS